VKVLMVMAHCDDEVVFGWPMLQSKEYEIELLVCSHKADRKKRCLDMCNHLQIKANVLDFPCGFYSMETKDSTRKKFLEHIIREVSKKEFDFIFTHNPWGEYGHDDHRLLSAILFQKYTNIITTDIFLNTNWLPETSLQGSMLEFLQFASREQIDCTNDLTHYNKCLSFYGGKAWDKEPVKQTTIYEF